jgi:hypothetical protein
VTRQVLSRDTRFDVIKIAMAYGAAGTEGAAAGQWAVNRWGEANAPMEVIKAAVPALNIADLDNTSVAGMIDRALMVAVRERAMLFRMRGIRRTGFNTRAVTVGGTTAVWVAPGRPIPVLQPQIDATGLDPAVIASLSVWTERALETSPGIEAVIFDDLVRALANGLDAAFIDPANAGAGIPPASITHGAPAIAAGADLGADIANLIGTFAGDLASAYFLTSPATAAALAATQLGRDIGARGGELVGVPVLTGNVPGGQLTLVDPTGVQAAWDEEAELSSSREGAVEMRDSGLQQDATTGAGANLVSLWQLNLVAIRANTHVAWATARAGSVVSLIGLAGA